MANSRHIDGHEAEVLLYQTNDGHTRVEVRFDGETAWLSLGQLTELFQRDTSVVSQQIKNVFDQVQRCPEILSYLQGMVDGSQESGRFVLTGSQHFGLMEKISQSLASRVGVLHLLRFSLRELTDGGAAPDSLDALLFAGGYPSVHDGRVSPKRWYKAYLDTYFSFATFPPTIV